MVKIMCIAHINIYISTEYKLNLINSKGINLHVLMPSELLYADYPVIMAPTMEQLGRRVADWRAGLLGKGLKVNAGKSKVMVGSKRCSGVRGDLSRVADGFRCRRCDGTIQEVELAEDLMVVGETYECVNSFCYLGDTLDGDGGADLAATASIRNGWMKFRELFPFLTSRAPPL